MTGTSVDSGQLRRSPASFPGDQPVAAGFLGRCDDQRLDDPVFANRGRQFFKLLRIEVRAGLMGIGADGTDGNHLQTAGIGLGDNFGRGRIWSFGVDDQGAKPASQTTAIGD